MTTYLENVDLLLAHLLGQRDNHPVALDGGGERKPNTGVARSRFNERVARLDATRALSILYV